jgi:protein-S-isoprenylcysteine O-methyltransferase Ste14
MLWRVLPLICVLSLVGLAICWRMWSQRRRYGTFGVRLFRAGTLKYWMRDALLVTFFVLATSQAMLVAFLPERAAMLGRLRSLESSALRMAGFVLAISATVALVIGQEQLGPAWRVGIDETLSSGLRTDGLYAFCRNPIYVSWLVWTIGYILLLPTVVSTGTLLVLTVAIRWYVEEEERYLTRAHGDAYRTYGRRVGRFLPGLGRFRERSP